MCSASKIQLDSKKTFPIAQAAATKYIEKRLDYWENIRDMKPDNLVF